jgi:O-methyltransferase involved in polyketide biosynthesis
LSEVTAQVLSGAPEPVLMTLYIRATESQRPDAQIKDEKAVAPAPIAAAGGRIRVEPILPGQPP